MSRYVIEIQNARYDAPSFVHPGRLMPALDDKGVQIVRDGKPINQIQVTSTGVLCLHPGTRQNPTAIRVTSAQFLEYSYEIEGKVEGKYGCEKEIELYALEVDSGRRERYTYEQAASLIAHNMNDDAAALEDQAKQEAEIQKLADDRDAEEREADAVDDANAVRASL